MPNGIGFTRNPNLCNVSAALALCWYACIDIELSNCAYCDSIYELQIVLSSPFTGSERPAGPHGGISIGLLYGTAW